jgi:penicillin-binding protein 2A
LDNGVVLLLKREMNRWGAMEMAPTKDPKPSGKKGKKKKKFNYKGLIIGSIISAIIAVICALGVYILVMLNGTKILNDNIDKINTMAENTMIYDVNNQPVSTLYPKENRESVTIDQVPKKLQDAFIATEDRRFATHSGIDFWAIGRAVVKDILNRSAVEGGSTITQQLAKNVFLNSQKTAFRKASEVSIAIALDKQFTKDQILEKYLNRIYFGSGAYGIKAASMVYFGQSDLTKLATWQMATLAALPKAPSTYSPIENPDKSKDRRAVVLKLMADQGYITEAERAEAAAQDYVAPANAKVGSNDYATFFDYVVKEAQDVYNIDEDELLTKGYRINTTMDPKAQKIMEQTYANPKFFQKDASDGAKIQSSMVILNNKDGGIVGMIGGRDYQKKGLNRAFSLRQPGSSFKPIAVYGPAIESGKYTPYSMIDDTVRTYPGGYTPHNYDNNPHGLVTMFEAVKHSYNLAAVGLLNDIGVNTGFQFATKLGIPLDTKNDKNLAIALGGLTNGVSPMSMASAYTAFANQGTQNKSHAIVSIMDSQGGQVAAFKPEKKEVMSPKTAWYVTLLLQGVTDTGGTGVRAKFDRPVAGKTGSTGLDIKGLEKYDRDVWFVGYTPEWTAAVWQGFDRTDAKHVVTIGSGSTAAIFKEVMSKALAGRPMTAFTKSSSVPDLKEPPKGVTDFTAVYAPETKSVKLSWTPMDGISSYQVFRSDTKAKDPMMLIQSATTEVNDTTILPGETYQYYVVPVNADTSIGDKSNTADIQIPADSSIVDPLNPSSSPLPTISPVAPPDGLPTPSISPSASPGASVGANGQVSGKGTGDKASPSPSPTQKPNLNPNLNTSPSPSPIPAVGFKGEDTTSGVN